MSRFLAKLAVGAVLLIAAAAGFIVVPEHAPGSVMVDNVSGAVVDQCATPEVIPGGGVPPCTETHIVHTGLSQTGYDVARVATWACVIVGVLVMVVCLIGYARRPRPGVA